MRVFLNGGIFELFDFVIMSVPHFGFGARGMIVCAKTVGRAAVSCRATTRRGLLTRGTKNRVDPIRGRFPIFSIFYPLFGPWALYFHTVPLYLRTVPLYSALIFPYSAVIFAHSAVMLDPTWLNG